MAEAPKTGGGRVEVSFTMPSAKSLVDATVEVRYRNVGTEDLEFRPPGKSPKFYRGLKAIGDGGENLKYLVADEEVPHPAFTDQVIIKSQADYTFSLRLTTVWQMSLDWRLVEFQTTDFHQPTSKAARATVVNKDERFIFAVGKVTTPDGKVEITFSRVFPPKAKALITIKKNVDPAGPILAVRYTNTGKSLIMVPIPEKQELSLYLGLSLKADGKTVPRVSTNEYGYPVISKEKQLAPGESVSFDVPIQSVWKMPENWESLEVSLTGSHAPGNAAGSAEIEGDRKFVFQKKDLEKPVGPPGGAPPAPAAASPAPSAAPKSGG